MNNEFLTIQEFIAKYEVPDVRIRRRIRKYRLVDPQKLEGALTERYDKGVGNIILLNEDFWVKELDAVAKDTAYAEPLRQSEEPVIQPKEVEPTHTIPEPAVYAEPLKQSEDIEPSRVSADSNSSSSDQITVDKEFLEILKQDRAEKKDWIKKYDSLFVDYKAKDNELVEREKFLQGLIEKIITDARNTKQLLASQINHLQTQLHTPNKDSHFGEAGEGIKFENGNFTESEEEQSTEV